MHAGACFFGDCALLALSPLGHLRYWMVNTRLMCWTPLALKPQRRPRMTQQSLLRAALSSIIDLLGSAWFAFVFCDSFCYHMRLQWFHPATSTTRWAFVECTAMIENYFYGAYAALMIVLERVVHYRQWAVGNSPEGWDAKLPCRQLNSWKHIYIYIYMCVFPVGFASVWLKLCISKSSLCPSVFGFSQDWSDSICLSLKSWSCYSSYRSSSKGRSRLLCHPPGPWTRKNHLNVPLRRRCWVRNLVLCSIIMALRLRARLHIYYLCDKQGPDNMETQVLEDGPALSIA